MDSPTLSIKKLWRFTGLVSIVFSSGVFAVEEPEDYRLDTYDAPVPLTLSGARRVTSIEVERLMSEREALVVDVIPEHRKPDNLPAGQHWFAVPHTGIEGALWLPDVGYGILSSTTEAYFKRHLSEATHASFCHPLVFYCRMDCWMSWNAAKRALSYGYSQVFWFADGITDWQFEGFETSVLQPAPGKRH